MGKCLAEIFLPRHNLISPSPTTEQVLNDDLVPRSMWTPWNSFGCETTSPPVASIFAQKSIVDMTFPLSGVDDNTVDAILHSINNRGNHSIPIFHTHTEDEYEEAGANDDTLSDMYL